MEEVRARNIDLGHLNKQYLRSGDVRMKSPKKFVDVKKPDAQKRGWSTQNFLLKQELIKEIEKKPSMK